MQGRLHQSRPHAFMAAGLFVVIAIVALLVPHAVGQAFDGIQRVAEVQVRLNAACRCAQVFMYCMVVSALHN